MLLFSAGTLPLGQKRSGTRVFETQNSSTGVFKRPQRVGAPDAGRLFAGRAAAGKERHFLS